MSSAWRLAQRWNILKTSPWMTGGNCGTTSWRLSTSRKSETRTAMLFPHAPTYRAASPPYGCTRNPRAAYRTSMPLSAVWTRTGTSTTTTPSTYGHNGQLKRSHGKGAGLPPCTYTRRTSHKSVPIAWKPCVSLTNGHGTVTRNCLPPKGTICTCARTRRM